jgi:hypothetical protein
MVDSSQSFHIRRHSVWRQRCGVCAQDAALGVMRRLAKITNRAVVRNWRRAFYNRNYVYVYDSYARSPAKPEGFSIVRYTRFEDVPPAVQQAHVKFRGRRYPVIIAAEIEDGAVFWVGSIRGEVVASQCTRRGDRFRRWFVPLAPADIVVFGGGLPHGRGATESFPT